MKDIKDYIEREQLLCFNSGLVTSMLQGVMVYLTEVECWIVEGLIFHHSCLTILTLQGTIIIKLLETYTVEEVLVVTCIKQQPVLSILFITVQEV